MKEKSITRVLGFMVALVAGLLLNQAFCADLSLSVAPYEGGFDLRYGKVDPSLGRINKEVNVRITSDLGKQYRLVQNLLEPLSTQEGASMPNNAFYVYGLRGTNQYGTINVEQERPAGMGRQVLYTSNQNGMPDSFTLVYGLNLPADVAPGSYRGRIGFSLEPIDASQAPVIVILNMLAEVSVDTAIDIKTEMGSNSLLLKADQKEDSTGAVVFSIRGGFGKRFRIVQVVEQPVSPEGNVFGWGALQCVGQGAQKGMVMNQATDLSGRQQVIYTSSVRGDADSFVMQYNLADLIGEKAGRYRGKIKYILEGIDFPKTELLSTIWLEIDNPRIFELVVNPELGGSISFRDLKPLQPPKMQEVVFEVKSNLGKQYQVTQDMEHVLTNKEGVVIPSDNFLFFESSLDTKGVLKVPSRIAMKEGQTVLFVSDRLGSPDKFKVTYEITLPRDFSSGDYATNFSFTVSEI